MNLKNLPALLCLATPLWGAAEFAEITVVDDATGRGVPLMFLETVDHTVFVTDNAGKVAFGEPGLMHQSVFFEVSGHGYELAKDGFGMRGVRIKTDPATPAEIRVKRLNIAERVDRLTGTGLYRDTILLGHLSPIGKPLLNAQVVGQDSAQVVEYQGTYRWFWGDTSRLSYPLGNFRTTGATVEKAGSGNLNPLNGINYRYLQDKDGFTKQMCPFEPREGVVWIDGLCVVPDATGKDRMVTRFARLKGLTEQLEHGLAFYDDAKDEFQRGPAFPEKEPWRYLMGQSLRVDEGKKGWILSCNPFPYVRVPAKAEALGDINNYEAWTCLADGSGEEAATATVLRDATGKPSYRWTKSAPPVKPKLEQALVKAGKLKPGEAQLLPADVETGNTVLLHTGTVRWNPHRQRWVLIAVQEGGGGPSYLGEVWYGEAKSVNGPWKKVRRIVTHNSYTFYNPVHHAFMDQGGGRFIHFEGTYTTTFSGNKNPTPRYEYNQILYRLDLDDPRLAGVRVE